MASEADRERNRKWRAENLDRAREAGRRSYHKNKAKVQEYSRRWYEANKDRLAVQRQQSRHVKKNQDLKRLYGLTLDEFQALQEKQDHRCAVCGEIAKLVVDHNHSTGLVRGLLCSSCNRALGYAKENPVRLRALAEWIEKKS